MSLNALLLLISLTVTSLTPALGMGGTCSKGTCYKASQAPKKANKACDDALKACDDVVAAQDTAILRLKDNVKKLESELDYEDNWLKFPNIIIFSVGLLTGILLSR